MYSDKGKNWLTSSSLTGLYVSTTGVAYWTTDCENNASTLQSLDGLGTLASGTWRHLVNENNCKTCADTYLSSAPDLWEPCTMQLCKTKAAPKFTTLFITKRWTWLEIKIMISKKTLSWSFSTVCHFATITLLFTSKVKVGKTYHSRSCCLHPCQTTRTGWLCPWQF